MHMQYSLKDTVFYPNVPREVILPATTASIEPLNRYPTRGFNILELDIGHWWYCANVQ
jgi:hypothetical protein